MEREIPPASGGASSVAGSDAGPGSLDLVDFGLLVKFFLLCVRPNPRPNWHDKLGALYDLRKSILRKIKVFTGDTLWGIMRLLMPQKDLIREAYHLKEVCILSE